MPSETSVGFLLILFLDLSKNNLRLRNLTKSIRAIPVDISSVLMGSSFDIKSKIKKKLISDENSYISDVFLGFQSNILSINDYL